MSLVPLIIIGVWLFVLTILVVNIYLSLRRLSKDSGQENLVKLLNSILDQNKNNELEFKEIRNSINTLGKDGLKSVQKMGLTKFNPFQELGGEHSFSLALLNGKDTGVIITGLHARDKTRIYLKAVVEGRGDVELSEEESKSLKLAIKGNKEQ